MTTRQLTVRIHMQSSAVRSKANNNKLIDKDTLAPATFDLKHAYHYLLALLMLLITALGIWQVLQSNEAYNKKNQHRVIEASKQPGNRLTTANHPYLNPADSTSKTTLAQLPHSQLRHQSASATSSISLNTPKVSNSTIQANQDEPDSDSVELTTTIPVVTITSAPSPMSSALKPSAIKKLTKDTQSLPNNVVSISSGTLQSSNTLNTENDIASHHNSSTNDNLTSDNVIASGQITLQDLKKLTQAKQASRLSTLSLNSDIPIQIFSENMVRAQFTTTVKNQEPLDNINSLIDRPDGLNEVSFFTELKDMKGDEVTHTWSYRGIEMAKITMPINDTHWRSFSKKYLDPNMTGIWQVVVTNKAGNTIAAGYMDYQVMTN